jgi:hypothetical protein
MVNKLLLAAMATLAVAQSSNIAVSREELGDLAVQTDFRYRFCT